MATVGPLSGNFKAHPNYQNGKHLREMDASETVYLAQLLTASGAPSFASPEFYSYMDSHDKINYRHEFKIPAKINVWPQEYRASRVTAGEEQKADDLEECAYMAGNSLGLMPKRSTNAVLDEMKVWGEKGVLGHTEHPFNRDWVTIDEASLATTAKIVGAHVSEVAVMGTLTANLHLLFTSFYKPTAKRHKILFEGNAFPSDAYAFASQLALHNVPPTSLLTMNPLPGEYTIRTEEILGVIEEHGHEISIICFGAVQYYSGQWFDMQTITKAGHDKGCFVAWDCAHAVGNVPLKLHEWGVDFAVWCSYKYLNSGPGGIGGVFVHQAHAEKRRLQGWWGHDLSTRFAMPPAFSPAPGAAGWQLSNPSVLNTICLQTSLELFASVTLQLPRRYVGSQQQLTWAPIMDCLRDKSVQITTYLEVLLQSSQYFVHVNKLGETPNGQARFTIITPSDPAQRGAQLSLLFSPVEAMDPIFAFLRQRGVLGDERRPGVIRLAPIPLYSSYRDCAVASIALEASIKEYIGFVDREKRRIEQQELMRKVEAEEHEAQVKKLTEQLGSTAVDNVASPTFADGLNKPILDPEILAAMEILKRSPINPGREPVEGAIIGADGVGAEMGSTSTSETK